MDLQAARARLSTATRVAVLTGAGVSAESGIPTFRDAQTGLWARFTPEDLASPRAYARDPDFVWSWYAERYATCLACGPNAAHRALARLEQQVGAGFNLVTQNVDGLHARAGSRNLTELHGNLASARCERCGHVQALPSPAEFTPPSTCERCSSRARPNIVWFGELLPEQALETAWAAFEAAEVALVIGTSSLVQPAASLGLLAKQAGAYLIEVNPDETPLTLHADLHLRSGAVAAMALLLDAEPSAP